MSKYFSNLGGTRVSIFPLIQLAAMSAIATVVFSCNQMSENRDRITQGQQSNIVSGPREETFTERYRVSLSLPMSEQAFLKLLRRLKLSYEVVGERNTATEILIPLHSRSLDLSKIKRSYQIYGDVGRVGKKYRAYVDRDNRVVYIENAFSYPIP
jgi:hypothetical protein